MNDPVLRINRRDVLNLALAAGTVSPLVARSVPAAEPESFDLRIVDTNVSLFQWPFRRLPLDHSEALVKKLRTLGISQAWAGSFEGLLHRDITGVNERLKRACDNDPELIPIGSINLAIPSWEVDFHRCVEQHNMPGVRLHPNYHGYTLDDPRFAQLVKQATAAGRFVQVAVTMEDTRTQNELVRVEDVNLTPLPDVLAEINGARVQLLNARLRSTVLDRLAQTPGLYFETARVEGTDGVPTLLSTVPAGRVLFGTHAPFLIPEAALIRVHESSRLDEAALRELLSKNAEQFLQKGGA